MNTSQLALTVILGAGIWVSALALAVSLCMAAKGGDQALHTRYAPGEESDSPRHEAEVFARIRERMAQDAVVVTVQSSGSGGRVGVARGAGIDEFTQPGGSWGLDALGGSGGARCPRR